MGYIIITCYIAILCFTNEVSGKSCSQSGSECDINNQEYEAINWLHSYLDDDKDGEIDTSESAEFLATELHDPGDVTKQTSFHRNDSHISVDELWDIWITSKPHNWTTEELIYWLETYVELPEYSQVFADLKLTGASLPLIAANWNHFLSQTLLVRSAIHKKKLIVKAQDVILFGPPARSEWITTLLLEVILVLITLGISFFIFYRRHNRGEIDKLKSELDHLRKAEKALNEMQKRLDDLQQNAAQPLRDNDEKNTITEKVKDGGGLVFEVGEPQDSDELDGNVHSQKLQQLEAAEEEVERLRRIVAQLESEIEMSNRIKQPDVLEKLLISTYQIESRWLESRLSEAQRRMTSARETCEKMGRKQSHIFGILRVSHSTLVEVDRTVLEARLALDNVRADVEERFQRWKHIEELTGFHILNQEDDMISLITGATSVEFRNRKYSITRTASSILKTRGSSIFDMSLENLINDEAAVKASPKMASIASSRTTLSGLRRRESWLSTDQNCSADSATDSTAESTVSNKQHGDERKAIVIAPSNAVITYEAPLSRVVNGTRRRTVAE